MSTPTRISDTLYKEAEAEGELLKRSAAKQVEFWAELGKHVAHSISPANVLSLLQGVAKIQIVTQKSPPLDPLQVFQGVKEAGVSGYLGDNITKGVLYYQTSQQHPGLLEQILPDGSVKTGQFNNGIFIEATVGADRR